MRRNLLDGIPPVTAVLPAALVLLLVGDRPALRPVRGLHDPAGDQQRDGHEHLALDAPWSCVNSEPVDQDEVSIRWFEAQEVTAADPGRLTGAYDSPVVRSGWEFVNSP